VEIVASSDGGQSASRVRLIVGKAAEADREIPVAVSTTDTSAPLTTEPAGSVINPLRLPLAAAVCAPARRAASAHSASARSAIIFNISFEPINLLLNAAFLRYRGVNQFLRINKPGNLSSLRTLIAERPGPILRSRRPLKLTHGFFSNSVDQLPVVVY
jgi:hypothetical protein